MDVVERLTLEAAQADTMLACEHRHRYEFAATMAREQRVLDLCCGSGYGSSILARVARGVMAVDADLATIDLARVTVGQDHPHASFVAADAVEFLGGDIAERFDLVVCFEGLEHLDRLPEALERLREHAERGLRVIASVPNDRLFQTPNPFHVTSFGYREAMAAFAGFPNVTMIPQFLAEGSLILPPDAEGVAVEVGLEDRLEPEYANHFIFCINLEEATLRASHHGRIQVATSPVFNRWSEDLKRGAWALRRENARLGRRHLGQGGSAAASGLARLRSEQSRTAELELRWRMAVGRIAELETELLDAERGRTELEAALPSAAVAEGAEVLDTAAYEFAPGEHPNSWEQRRRRAAEVLVPWIEQTVPLRGRTVLEYGCGNAAVSSAFAPRVRRLIGLDIDEAALELGRRELAARKIGNVELHHHPVEEIQAAAARLRGKVDVVLLYAVLEHLTVAERLAVLRLAREIVRPDGAIVVCETPNRLTLFDHHTAQMPFFHLLPDELGAEVYGRSARVDFTDAVQAAAATGGEAGRHEAIVRWGRGVSFHEFEVVFGELSRHVIASSYDSLLFSERPVHPEEVTLARYLSRVRPDLAPAFSRQWLDVILSPQPVERRPPFLWPWTAETAGARGVSWTRWDNLRFAGPGARLPIELPVPTTRLVIGAVTQDGGPLTLRLAPEGAEGLIASPPVQAAAHVAGYVSFRLPAPAQRLVLAVSAPCHVVWIGYEA